MSEREVRGAGEHRASLGPRRVALLLALAESLPHSPDAIVLLRPYCD
jgi:hypothetical protein